MLKGGIRILALDDAAFNPLDKRVLVIGAVGKQGSVEGAISFKIRKDGNDATEKLVKKLRISRFGKQIRLLATQSIMLGGLNYIDLFEVKDKLGLDCVALTRKRPNLQSLLNAIDAARPEGAEQKKREIALLYHKAEKFSDSGFYFLTTGIGKDDLHGLVYSITSLLRLAHIFASAVGKGESSTRL